MITIRVDDTAAQELTRMSRDMGPAIHEGVRAVEVLASRVADRQIGRIYARRIPNRPRSGKPMWRRTQNLARGRMATYPNPHTAVISVGGPAAVYAYPRHQLGVSWMPQNPASGVIRRNPFFADTERIIAPQVGPVFEQAVKNRLHLKG